LARIFTRFRNFKGGVMARGPLAGASGPGKYSKRTDMSFGSTSYGEGGETAALNTAAPKSKTRGIADDVGGRPADPLTPVTPLFAPTERRDEPVTAGIAAGDGPGPEALMMQSKFAQRKLSDILADMIPYDDTGDVAILYQQVIARGQ
jgi:hypothetical protein